jgi:hypothetical protein
MVVVLARESLAWRQSMLRKLAVRLAREIFNIRKASAERRRQKQKVAIHISLCLPRRPNLLSNNNLYEQALRPERFPAERASFAIENASKHGKQSERKRDDLPSGDERRAEKLPRQLFTNI